MYMLMYTQYSNVQNFLQINWGISQKDIIYFIDHVLKEPRTYFDIHI